MSKPAHNPERRAWKGRSYKKGGERVRDLKEKCNSQVNGGKVGTMAQLLTLIQARQQFPGAVEALDPEDLMEYAPDDDEPSSELWTHNGTLYSRSWWTGYGWHYGQWSQEHGWHCPPDGEVICPWTGERS